MKIMVISDTHGLVKEVQEAINAFRPMKILHCGDFCVPADQTPFKNMIKVRGNCDEAPTIPLNRVVEWEGLKVWMTHGHTWRVKESLLPLSYKAEELGVHIVLFGHSHFPLSLFEKGRLYLNPGSFSKPRGYQHPTFVIIDLERGQKGYNLEVTYYNRNYNKVTDRGGNYHISV